MNKFQDGLLKYFTKEQLDKIASVKVGIAGLGGLGSNCAHNLVRTGFRKFILCDFDIVEYSNLNRQFYFLDQADKPKPDALKENLLRINPALDLTLSYDRVGNDNVGTIFSSCDVVIEAFDRAECKKLIVQAYINSDKLVVSASGLAGWGRSDEITVKNIHPNLYLVGDSVSEAKDGLPPCSPRVNVAAAKQADIILSWALMR